MIIVENFKVPINGVVRHVRIDYDVERDSSLQVSVDFEHLYKYHG